MKVSIYKVEGGTIDIMVEAATGHGKAPVVLQDVVKADLVARILPVLEAQKGRRLGPRPSVAARMGLNGSGTL